jgi:hypothetical protein
VEILALVGVIVGIVAGGMTIWEKVRSKLMAPNKPAFVPQAATVDDLRFPTDHEERWISGLLLPGEDLVVPAKRGQVGPTKAPVIEQLEPWYCEGYFFADGFRAAAFFVTRAGDASGRVHLVVASVNNPKDRRQTLVTLDSATEHYIRTAPPGDYQVRRAVWKHGGPKILTLHHDGIEFGKYEAFAGIYFWSHDEQQFKYQPMVD